MEQQHCLPDGNHWQPLTIVTIRSLQIMATATVTIREAAVSCSDSQH